MTKQRLAVIGAGPVGALSAVLAAERGHDVAIWAPRGAREQTTGPLRFACSGAHDGKAEIPQLRDAAALADWPTVLVAVPGNAYPVLLPVLLEHLQDGQTVILSGALSLSPLWLAEKAAARGHRLRIVAWGTTLGTGNLLTGGALALGTLRTRFDMAVLPKAHGEAGLALCTDLFGDKFRLVAEPLAPILSNVNPVAHAGQVIPNLTRIERGEAWQLFELFTPGGARIADAIDRERIAIAAAFGIEVNDLARHYHLSYHIPLGPMEAVGPAIEAQGRGPRGPASLVHRYIEEDFPYGLVVYEALGTIAGVATPAMSAAITLLSAALGKSLRAANPLLEDLRLAGSTVEALKARFT